MRQNSSGLFQLHKEILPQVGGNFTAIDPRFCQTSGLAVHYSTFFLLHNFIARGLAKINTDWDDERLFQESRRINGAIFQHIIYNEWLPTYLSKNIFLLLVIVSEIIFFSMHFFLGKSYIESSTIPKCKDYNPNVDPSMSAEFSITAFRSFHSLIPQTVEFVDANNVTTEMALSDTFFRADILETKHTKLLRGQSRQGIRIDELGYVDQVRFEYFGKLISLLKVFDFQIRNLLFKSDFRGEQVGLDLMLLDMMRGRDTGMPPYFKFFDFCLSTKIRSWKDLRPYFKLRNLKLLKSMYVSFKDIDALMGMLLEKRVHGLFGEIASCIIADQFYRTKCGDRFFHTHPSNPYPFTRSLYNFFEFSFSNIEKIPTCSIALSFVSLQQGK